MDSFGSIFRVTVFGESHGSQIGVVLDGVQPGIPLSEEDFLADIDRRRSGARGTTPRKESDTPIIISGVFEGHTTGAPLTVLFENNNTHSSDYSLLRNVPRPGHADYTASVKFDKANDPRGGGHFSGRLTLPIVAAGVVAKKMLVRKFEDYTVNAELLEIGGVTDKSAWPALLDKLIAEGDSVGGIVECTAIDIPVGLGEPLFDSTESLLSHAIFSIPGVRGVEFGDGFKASKMRGSEHNDPIGLPDGSNIAYPVKNGAGGINGGLTNGNPLVFRVAFKPTSSIHRPQETYDFSKEEMTSLVVPGRHDVCFALRTPVIVEAVTSIVLADLMLVDGARKTK